ncbi:MAG: BrnT family toxin [Crocosphaera sp.]|nr:BrnT family toxin [Crocosphaera sp.]
MEQEFEWDDRKNEQNIRKHKVSFDLARLIFLDDYLCRLDDRVSYNEERWQAIGQVSGIIIHVTYTIRKERIRIISARKASKIEKQAYYDYGYS